MLSATSLSKVDSSTFHQISLTDPKSDDAWVEQSFETKPLLSFETKTLGPAKCLIYDTTLRDGTQMESINVSCNDKLKIVRQLCEFGMMDYIECGWPGSNPKDAEFFKRALTELSSPMRQKLVAFGSTRRKHIAAQEDAQIQALLDAQTPTVCLVAKGHLWQVTDILRATPDENLYMIADSVSYLVSQNRRVFVDLEHFFDGYKHNADYAMMCANAAANAGASGLVLCDTNGGTMPWDVERITKVVVDSQRSNHQVTVGIHCHNDCGMATANSIVAVQSGAGMIQGTVNGIGERTGNANLCTIIPSLQLHMNTTLQNPHGLVDITTLSRFVDETMNRMNNPSAPFVGLSAFAHKGGLHVAALERSPDSYQHIDPAKVGNEQRILVSELSGRQNIIGKIKEAGVELGTQINERATAILERVKTLENIGYTFEGAEASVHLMILHASGSYCPPFRVLDYSAQVFDQNMDSASRYLLDGKKKTARTATSRATIKVRTANLQNNVLEGGSNPPNINQLEGSWTPNLQLGLPLA